MVTVCQKCGDTGYSVALIYCDNCQVYAEHRYCLDVLPETFDEYVTWFCEDCELKVGRLSTINKTIPLPLEISHSVHLEKVEATQSRIGLGKKNPIKRLKKKKKKTKRKDITGSIAKTELQICENSPSLQPHETCGRNCEKGQKVGQELALVPIDGAKSHEEAESVNPSLRCHEMHCCETYKKGQKVGLELALVPRDGADSNEEAESVNPSLRCHEMHCCETYKKRQKVGQEFALVPRDGANSNEEAEVNPSLRCHKMHCCETYKKGQKLGQELGVELTDGANSNEEAEHAKTSRMAFTNPSNIVEHKCYVDAQPIISPIWRGSLCIYNKNIGTFVAHLSSIACSKVYEEAKLLPELLYVELFRRSDVWPKGFKKWGPTDQSIALYLFPGNESDDKVFDGLMDGMISQDLAMRARVKNAELLVFASAVLPMKYWRFQSKFYLWGVFRQASDVTKKVFPQAEKDTTNALAWDRQSPISPLSNGGSYGSSSLYSFCGSAF